MMEDRNEIMESIALERLGRLLLAVEIVVKAYEADMLNDQDVDRLHGRYMDVKDRVDATKLTGG